MVLSQCAQARGPAVSARIVRAATAAPCTSRPGTSQSSAALVSTSRQRCVAAVRAEASAMGPVISRILHLPLGGTLSRRGRRQRDADATGDGRDVEERQAGAVPLGQPVGGLARLPHGQEARALVV